MDTIFGTVMVVGALAVLVAYHQVTTAGLRKDLRSCYRQLMSAQTTAHIKTVENEELSALLTSVLSTSPVIEDEDPSVTMWRMPFNVIDHSHKRGHIDMLDTID